MITEFSNSNSSTFPVPVVPSPWAIATDALRALIQQVGSAFVMCPDFTRSRDLFDKLPIGDSEIESLVGKSRMAEASYIRGEKTAAATQLNILLRLLCQHRDSAA